MSTDSTTGLIVPIDVAAFCVGESDANAVNGFAGATTDYRSQAAPALAFLGSNVALTLSDPPLEQLEQGVHLHWALPDALTRARVGNASSETPGTLEFPAAPSRFTTCRVAASTH